MYKTIHHQACTGGTLISKTIAAMHKVRLLSEVNPNGPFTGPIQFDPTGLVSQYCKRYGRNTEEFRFNYFSDQLDLLYKDCSKLSSHLVLRDHCHNEYMSQDYHENRTPLLGVLKFYGMRNSEALIDIKSVVTVRHPLDSYLSCLKKGWVEKIGRSLDVYSQRYIKFIEDYDGAPLFKYEDFCLAPAIELEKISTALDLPFDSSFEERFYKIRLTGDSGRTSEKIELKSRREVADDVRDSALSSSSFQELCNRLGYGLNDI